MFDSLLGIPAHPLFVHLSVIAVPVAALVSVFWGLRPQKPTLFPWALGLSLLGVVSTLLSRTTGESLLVMQGLGEQNPGPLAQHAMWANYMTGSVLVLAGVLAVVWVSSRVAALRGLAAFVPALRVLAIVAALATIAFVVLTGHAGAQQVWAQP